METKNEVKKKMPILTVEEAREKEWKVQFEKDVRELHRNIQIEIDDKKIDSDPELRDVNMFYIKEYQKLLDIPITNQDELKEVSWLFNHGELRTETEISNRNTSISNKQYVDSGKYESDCLLTKMLFGIFGFLIPFGLLIAVLWNSWSYIAIIPALFVGLLISFIAMMAASAINVSNAEQYEVPEDHPRYRHDKTELQIGKAATVIGTASVLKHTKKAIKDIGDVENWDKKV